MNLFDVIAPGNRYVVIGILALGLIVAAAHGQSGSVRLKVTKQRKAPPAEAPPPGEAAPAPAPTGESIHYTIELTNLRGGARRDFTVKWAVLARSETESIHPVEGEQKKAGPLRVIEGERRCAIKFGKSFAFDTDPISGEDFVSILPPSGASKQNARVLGYAVEVFSGGERLAFDIQPADAKARIDRLRGKGDKAAE
jgi:hypothetical protein